MFKTFFFAEIKNAFKSPMLYIFIGLITALVLGAVSSDNIQIGGSVGNVYKNAPHIITVYTTIMTLFGLLIATAFYNNAALRDHQYGFNEILFSTPLSKPGYFFGRFFGALFLATIPMLGVFIGVLLGTVLAPAFGWASPDRFGDLYLQTFINNYFLFILPNMFFAGTIIFALANKTKSTIISFVGTLAIIIGYAVSASLMSDIENQTLAGLADPFGIRAYVLYAKYYTPIEKNTLIPGFSGVLLLNRLIWIGSGCVILALSYFSFSFQNKNKKVKAVKDSKKTANEVFILPQLNPSFSKNTAWLQFKSFFYINFLSIVKSVTFKILLLFSAIIVIIGLLIGFEYYGLQSYPLTYKVANTISNESRLYMTIILVFFSGELIWRDRESKISEVIDATPHTSFLSLAAKALSLISVAAIIHLFLIVCGILYQLAKGYSQIELDVYFLDFFFDSLVVYIVWSGIMILIHVLLSNKYIGYFVSILIVFVSALVFSAFDIESNMLFISAGPSIQYSDMNGFGPGLLGSLWFSLYWILFSTVCLFIAAALWNRGLANSLKNRFLIAKKQLPKTFRWAMVIVILVWGAVAGNVFYNTQVLNTYKTGDQLEQLAADYEKKYKAYENAPLPKVTDIKYFVDIFPNDRDVFIKANIQFTNETENPIDSLIFTIDSDWKPVFDIPNAKLTFEDEEFGLLVYTLTVPILPGESIQTQIRTEYITKGFENTRGNTNIIKNGTFLNNFSFLPQLGYAERKELSDKNTRKKHDLAPKKRMPELEENCTKSCQVNYLTNGTGDFINIETVISTSSDQTAIASGSLIKQWTENGRNFFHYKVDHASLNFMSFISAKYEIAKRKWNGIDIEVYHDKKHDVNVEMMLDAIERSLAYYTENFGPYYHKQCRIIEFPRYANFAQAFPGTMPYSESFGFVVNLEDEDDNNVIDAVVSHEMAHQWWAHQLIGANMQGGTMLSESFSEYSSLMVMKSIDDDPMKMRQFLKYNHDRYLRGRGNETVKELPLYKVENQMYIHYGKGSIIMYAMQDYIGEDSLNLAMSEFLNAYKYQTTYPTTLDFLSYLEPKVPDSLKYLIDDWFKEITLYDNRMESATYTESANGKYQITVDIESVKIKADSMGNETKVTINDWIDIGFFADSEEKDLMFNQRVKINQPNMSFTFELDSIPAKAAIDPRRLLIDRVFKDNTKTVKYLSTEIDSN